MELEHTPKETTDERILVFPIKGCAEILFFQSKQEMLKSAVAYPNVVIPILGGGNDTELDDMFQNVYCALRKYANDVEGVSPLAGTAEQSAQNLFATQQ